MLILLADCVKILALQKCSFSATSKLNGVKWNSMLHFLLWCFTVYTLTLYLHYNYNYRIKTDRTIKETKL